MRRCVVEDALSPGEVQSLLDELQAATQLDTAMGKPGELMLPSNSGYEAPMPWRVLELHPRFMAKLEHTDDVVDALSSQIVELCRAMADACEVPFNMFLAAYFPIC